MMEIVKSASEKDAVWNISIMSFREFAKFYHSLDMFSYFLE